MWGHHQESLFHGEVPQRGMMCITCMTAHLSVVFHREKGLEYALRRIVLTYFSKVYMRVTLENKQFENGIITFYFCKFFGRKTTLK